MGYYLQVPGLMHGKAAALAEMHGGQLVSRSDAAQAMADPSKGVVVVMDNGLFEAAGFACDMREWDAFTGPSDPRPVEFVVMDRETAERESGFERRTREKEVVTPSFRLPGAIVTPEDLKR